MWLLAKREGPKIDESSKLDAVAILVRSSATGIHVHVSHRQDRILATQPLQVTVAKHERHSPVAFVFAHKLLPFTVASHRWLLIHLAEKSSHEALTSTKGPR